ncbi:hypothetical protein HPP92_020370 [Vanilla planifolia]|uniref:PB1 domain-containing protein n=1 Tax=Vanilla planifolia TaxID=51239 RepID=A0A835Q2L6_VANPL|nr:hypothetical protein HPP92_020370 [Vanilla planifolia]
MDGGVYDPSDNFPQYHALGSSGRIPSESNLRNISVQTGEEFSMEFLQDRAIPRGSPIRHGLDHGYVKKTGLDVKQNLRPGYEDYTGNFELRAESDFGCDVASPSFSMPHSTDSNIKNYADRTRTNFAGNDARSNGNQTCDFHECTSSERFHGFQTCSNVPRNSESPHTSKVKFLCSFGGKILPRPGDGKLRYVGGETRIFSMRKDISFENFMQKTTSIFSPPHSIKYQLPGEDLDALISVSSDEDLQNMMDEYYGLEKADGSQKLRIFLIPHSEADSSAVDTRGLQNSSDLQYVVAVNNIVDPIPKKSSSGNSLSSQVGYQLDRSLSFQEDPPFVQVDNLDCNGAQNNIGMHQHHPNSQPFVNFQITPTPATHSPPFSPKRALLRDVRHSRKQSFEDHFIAEWPIENSFEVHRGYLMNMDMPRVNAAMHVDAKMQTKQYDIQFQDQKYTKEFLPSAYNDRGSELGGHSYFEKPVLKEKNFPSEKMHTNEEEMVDWITGSNDSAGPIQGLPHAFPDTLLQGHAAESNDLGLGFDKSAVLQNSFQGNTQEGKSFFQNAGINHLALPSKLQRTALTASYSRPEFSMCDNYAESCGRMLKWMNKLIPLSMNIKAEKLSLVQRNT